jgi:hydroxyacylglutathione hydrolase
MGQIIVLSAGIDNCMYVLASGAEALVIDPGDASVVLGCLREKKLSVRYILNTHGHHDHTAGNAKLKEKTGACILAPESVRLSRGDQRLRSEETITLGDWTVRVLATPGHTPDGVSFFAQDASCSEQASLFSGDTLFRGGCGRVFGSSARDLWDSLCLLSRLDDKTRVYPGHDYAIENYEFALSVDPANEVFKRQMDYLADLRKNGHLLVPSTIGEEKELNIFLQSLGDHVREILALGAVTDADVFAALRKMKDSF